MSFIDLTTEEPVRVLDLVLARVGGLPVSAVPEPSQRVEDILRRMGVLEAELATVKDSLVDRIFEVVPVVADKGRRRALLAAKRRVYALRPTGIPGVQIDGLHNSPGSLERELAEALAAWDEQALTLEDLSRELDTALADDDSRMAQALFRTLQVHSYACALAIATPELVGRRFGRPDPGAASDRLLRSLYLYGTRTTRKTSPFSGLTPVAIAGRHGQGRQTARVAVHLAMSVLAAGARDGSAGNRCRVVASPRRAFPVENHESIVMLPELLVGNGVVFREEKVVGAENLPSELLALGEQPTRSKTLEEAASALGGDRPRTRLRRLLETGVVRPVVPWARGEAPEQALVSTFTEGCGPVSRSELDALSSVSTELRHAGPLERIDVLRTPQAVAEKVLTPGQLGQRSGGLLYEDCEFGAYVPDPLDAGAVREDLGRLAAEVRPWLFRSHIYDLLVRRFVDRFGRGGECREPLAWLMSMAVDNDGDPEPLQAIRRDQNLDEAGRAERAALPGGPSAPARHIAAYLQFAAPSLEDVLEGRGLTVVNALGSGVGALLARFQALFGKEYGEQVATLTRSLWPTDRVLEFQAWASANTAQAACTGILQELGLPGEPASGSGVWIDDLQLVHDVATDTIHFRDRQGPVGIAYLGLTPQHLLNSYFRWLAVIADPWFRFPPLGEQAVQLLAASRPEIPTQVVHTPRRQVGRLVWQRQSWVVPLQDVQKIIAGSDGPLVRRWARFREVHGIPAEVFVHQTGAGLTRQGDARKPIYAHLNSALSVHTLEKWLSPTATAVRLVEALPSRHQHWLTDAEGQSRVSEFLLHMHWPHQPRRDER